MATAAGLGPVRATVGAVGGVATPRDSTADASAKASANSYEARGRSTSPGQYSSYSARVSGGRAESHGQRTGMVGTLAAWPEAGMPSPRTPRQSITAGATELRLSVVVSELQRQTDADRRTMTRQLQQLERRLQEQVATPAVGRERWADLQGSVSGVIEEMSALSRRVEALDEKLRVRTANCEEVVRQRTRELEQQLHAQQHKALLAVSTSEEMQKRHIARLRKAGQAVEEHARRLDALEEMVRRPPDTARDALSAAQLDSRIRELDQRVASCDEELRGLLASTRDRETLSANGLGSNAANGRGDPDELEASIHTLEQELSALDKRTAAQLDEHQKCLANFRVRTDAQEQRLAAHAERLETVVAPPLEALRAEVAKGREYDRQEFESRVEHLSKRVQALADSGDEVGSQYREYAERTEDNSVLRRLEDASAAQEQALKRLEAQAVAFQQMDPHAAVGAQDLCGILVRVETLEHRLDCVERDDTAHELAEKADRSELLRLDAEIRELGDPMRRLSHRLSGAEVRTATLERKCDQLQQAVDTFPPPDAVGAPAAASAAGSSGAEELSTTSIAIDAIAKKVADLNARLVDVESLQDPSFSTPCSRGGAPLVGNAGVDEAVLEDVKTCVADLTEQFLDLGARVAAVSESAAEAALVAKTAESMQRHVEQLTIEQQEIRASHTQAISEALARLGSSEVVTSTVKEQVDELGNRLEEALARLDSNEDMASAVKGHVEQLRKRQEEALAGREATSTFEEKVDEVRTRQAEAFNRLGNGETVTSRIKEQVEDLRRKQDEALARLGRSEEATSTVKGQIEELQKKHGEEMHSDFRKQLQQLRSDHDALAANKAFPQDCEDRITEVLQQLADGEGHNKAVQEQVDAAVKALEARLEQLQHEKKADSQDEFADQKRKQEELTERMTDALQQVSSKEENILEIECRLKQEISQRITDAVQKVSSKQDSVLEVEGRLKQEFGQRITDALQQVSSKQDAVSEIEGRLKQAIQTLESRLESMSSVKSGVGTARADTSSFERQLEELRRDLRERDDMSDKIADVLKRASSRDDSVAVMSQKLDQAIQNLDERLEALRNDHEAMVVASREQTGSEEVAVDDAQLRVEEQIKVLQQQVEEELSTAMAQQRDILGVQALREATKTLQIPTESGNLCYEVEQQVSELSKMVAEEVEEVKRQQEELRKVKAKTSKDAIVAGAGVTGANTALHGLPTSALVVSDSAIEAVESQVEELARQMEEELQELKLHRQALAKAGSQQGSITVGKVESRVEELAKEVSTELEELAGQQQDLRRSKATLQHLTEQMDLCTQANADLRRRFDSLQKRGDVGRQLGGGSSTVAATVAPGEAAADPDLSDTYGDDTFDDDVEDS